MEDKITNVKEKFDILFSAYCNVSTKDKKEIKLKKKNKITILH
jgi:hypothetical protein